MTSGLLTIIIFLTPCSQHRQKVWFSSENCPLPNESQMLAHCVIEPFENDLNIQLTAVRLKVCLLKKE